MPLKVPHALGTQVPHLTKAAINEPPSTTCLRNRSKPLKAERASEPSPLYLDIEKEPSRHRGITASVHNSPSFDELSGGAGLVRMRSLQTITQHTRVPIKAARTKSKPVCQTLGTWEILGGNVARESTTLAVSSTSAPGDMASFTSNRTTSIEERV